MADRPSDTRENLLTVPPRWLESAIPITLVGVGGTGSEMLDGLVRIHNALIALGHPAGLMVTAYDPDTVSRTNTVRQRFLHCDIGHNKAVLSIHRINVYHGVAWQAHPRCLEPTDLDPYDHGILITCVDRAKVRQEIAIWSAAHRRQRQDWHREPVGYWLDTGNDRTSGQFVLGHLIGREGQRLPHIADLYPELLDDARVAELDGDDQPSCSAAEALASQDLFTNRTVANAACNLLWQWFRNGMVRHHGGYIDTTGQSVLPLRIDPQTWAAMGYSPERSA